MRKIESSNSNLLAVFWYIDGKFYGPCNTRDADEVEDYGGFCNLPYDHFFIWNDYKPSWCYKEYDEYPRGRVVYNAKIRKFIVITSQRLCEDDKFVRDVISEYGLPYSTLFDSDEHYDIY